jgi:tyrosyl-tRNA synthetase
VDEYPLPAGETIHLPSLLRDAGLVKSSSEARRLLREGAISIEGVRLENESLPRNMLAGAVVQIGRRRFVRFSLL